MQPPETLEPELEPEPEPEQGELKDDVAIDISNVIDISNGDGSTITSLSAGDQAAQAKAERERRAELLTAAVLAEELALEAQDKAAAARVDIATASVVAGGVRLARDTCDSGSHSPTAAKAKKD